MQIVHQGVIAKDANGSPRIFTQYEEEDHHPHHHHYHHYPHHHHQPLHPVVFRATTVFMQYVFLFCFLCVSHAQPRSTEVSATPYSGYEQTNQIRRIKFDLRMLILQIFKVTDRVALGALSTGWWLTWWRQRGVEKGWG